MAIGTLGDMSFEVREDKILTFNNMQRTSSARWTKHDIIGKIPYSEFLGVDLGSITLPIKLIAAADLKPYAILEQMRKCVEEGTPLTFVIGGHKIGMYQWVITQMSETWNKVYSGGQLASADVNLTLQEYR